MTTGSDITENTLGKADHLLIGFDFFFTFIPYRSSFSKKLFRHQPKTKTASLRQERTPFVSWLFGIRPVNEKAPVLFARAPHVSNLFD